MFHLGRIIIIN